MTTLKHPTKIRVLCEESLKHILGEEFAEFEDSVLFYCGKEIEIVEIQEDGLFVQEDEDYFILWTEECFVPISLKRAMERLK